MARAVVALLGLLAIAVSVWRIESVSAPLEIEATAVGTTPVTVRRLPGAEPAPAVVIAHGFAGSRQLMAPFAVTLTRAGYVTVTFDFLGHGRNPAPMTGDVTSEDGATRALLTELQKVVAFARTLPGTDGRVAVLGHSMAADIVVRAAIEDPEIATTVAVSMFSPVVSATEPASLLIVVGEWEAPLIEEGLRVLRLAAGPEAGPGEIHRDPETGTLRKLSIAPNVEHVGVLYSRRSLAEAQGWLDLTFGASRPFMADARGPWILLMLAGVVALGWPLARLLPRAGKAATAALRRPWLAILAPAVATPAILWPLPTDFLPVLVADYLAAHFALYGAILGGILIAQGTVRPGWPGWRPLAAAVPAAAFCILGPGLVIHLYAANFMPIPARLPLILALLAGTVLFTLAEEGLIRAPNARWWTGAASRTAFLLSLAGAIALDLESLFFLIIILPVILIFLIIYGLFARWIHGAAGHSVTGGLATGAAFAWALGVTFPLLG